jgi:arsenate reductase
VRPVCERLDLFYIRKEDGMNIQIFGKSKCFDTKKAERYFKERRIKYQMIDLRKHGMSLGEYKSVKAAVGGVNKLIDEHSKEYEDNYVKYLSGESDREEKLLEYQGMFQTPIVRNGRQATVGYQPDVWKGWV